MKSTHQAKTTTMQMALKLIALLLIPGASMFGAEPPTRSDTVAEKIRLLEDAYKKGRHDLAMSLAESLKDTLMHERHLAPHATSRRLDSASTKPVSDLPSAWMTWANGWTHFQPISLTESAGIDRVNEPVHARIAVSHSLMNDPWREIRVVRIDSANHTLREIPSQVMEHVRFQNEHQCEVVFLADVAANSSAHYLIFFGNANAELPAYATDLKAEGEGYALDVQNHHFKARLSRQMGQLERLTSKRQHGLELYAGGKGHGEPPSIDWAHDYVDKGNFQKLRIKNWADCPNYEVIRGPVCVRVRRWGFPHSPVHPLYTPSRMHVDQTYTFYARLPHFFKNGAMEVVKDMEIAAMRDDEWVLSGYSFDETLWIDRHGKVHEGNPPNEKKNDLWGVGFFHRTSRDAFVALWLEHTASGFPAIQHGGSPTLHYEGHGQLWSRYPAAKTPLKAGTVFRQRNCYLMTDYPEKEGPGRIASLRQQLVNPLKIDGRPLPDFLGAKAVGRLARTGETEAAGPLKRAVWQALRDVKDEQLYKMDANIVDMGYVYDVQVEDGIATVLVTMPHRGRPVHEFLVTQGGGRVQDGIQERTLRVPGIQDVVVNFTWEPAWTINRVTAKARAALEIKSTMPPK